MTCQDDATFTGPVSLFAGVETYNWSIQQFTDLANFAKSHGVSTLFIKAFEWGSTAGSNADGLWYGGFTSGSTGSMSGIDAIYQAIKAVGVNVIFYGFLYADPGNTAGNIRDATAILSKYGNVMLDMEGSQWSGAAPAVEAGKIAQALAPINGKVWLSYPANPVDAGQVPFLQAVSPAVNVWLPMAYTDYLMSVYPAQLAQVNPSACVMPTLDLTADFGPNDVLASVRQCLANGSPAISLWYEASAQSNSSLVDQVVALMKGNIPVAPTNPNGEVLSVNEADQFQPGKTQDACGFFACAIVRSGSPVGKAPQRSVQQIIDDAEMWYAQFDGDNSISNTEGMSLSQLYALIKQMTYDYRAIDLSKNPLAYIAAWVRLGFPVIIALAESSVYDLDLGGSPYYWDTSQFNHIITVTGIAKDGHFLCRDSASVTDLFNPNTLRPGPRRYDQNRFQLISATAVVMPWLPEPPPGFDPTKETLMGVPSGWTDVNTNGDMQLHNPFNSFIVRGDFREQVIQASPQWASWNVPEENERQMAVLEQSNPPLGSGVSQIFADDRLEMVANQANKIIHGWLGKELIWHMNALAQAQSELASAQSSLASETAKEQADEQQITSLEAQVASLQAQLQAATGITPEEQTAINNAVAALQALQPYISKS